MSLTVNSETYYQNIRNKLTELCSLVAVDNSLNIQSLNIHAEGFYAEFLNCLFDWNLVNANVAKQNAAGIDLIDEENRIIVQVSSTHTRDKIKKSLEKSDKEEYAGYHFYFVAIAENETNYRAFEVPGRLTFDKSQDVLSTPALLRHVLNAGIDKQKALSELMDKYFSSGEKKPKGQYLTEPPAKADKTNVICRDDELSEIEAMLKRGENILLMSGFGGIGKTALARLVFHTVKKNYDQVAWIPYNKNLKESMLSAILGLKGTDRETRWFEIHNIMNSDATKLIIIDNVDRDEKNDQYPQNDPLLRKISGFNNVTVILTSRLDKLYSRGSYSCYKVEFLSPDACVELFYKHYANDPDRAPQDVVKDLVELAKYHTLTIELIANAAEKETNLQVYYNKLKESFANAKLEVQVGHNEEYATIVTHLRALFDISNKSDEEKAVLWDFAVLPAGAALTPEETELWFQHNPNTLNQLQHDGWLAWSNDRYAMHPLVKEILHLDPIPKNTAEKFLAFIANWDKGYFSYNDIHTERDRKLALAESVVAAVCPEDTLQLGYIHDNMGTAYRQAGQYPQAEAHYLRAVKISEDQLGENHPATATTYNNIAGVYYAKGNLDKALEFYEKDLAISEAKLGEDHPSTAGTYNNIALVYKDMGNLDKALEFFEKALPIVKAKLGEDHPHTATTYNNIALVYQANGNLDKALEFFEKDLAISEAKLGKEHPDTAATYNNIASVYQAKGNLDKALEFYEKALAIREAKLGKDHPATATTYHNISHLHFEKKDYATAKGYLLRALQIRLRKLGPGHPDTQDTQFGLLLCHINAGNAPEAFLPWLMGQLDEEELKIFFAHPQEDRE